MALFFFHFFDGESHFTDDQGVELASAEVAFLEAAATARAMCSELLAERRNPLDCAFEIALATGEVLMRLDFSELLNGNPKRDARPAHASEVIKRAIEENHRRVNVARDDLRLSLEQARQSLAETNSLLVRLSAFERSIRKEPI